MLIAGLLACSEGAPRPASDNAPNDTGPGPGDWLALTEVGSWEAPEEFIFSDLARSDLGNLVLWSAAGQVAIVLDSKLTPVQEVPLPPHISPVAVGQYPDGTLAILGTEPAAIYRIDGDGEISESAEISLSGTVIHAILKGEKWFALVGVEGGGAIENRLLSILSSGDVQVVDSLDLPIGILSGSDSLVVLSEGHLPNRVISFSENGARVERRPPEGFFDSLTVATRGSSVTNWVSTGTIPFRAGWAQQVSDTTSNWFVLILWDEGGQPYMWPVFRGPERFLAGAESEHVLFAVRREEGLSVVKYRWEWSKEYPG